MGQNGLGILGAGNGSVLDGEELWAGQNVGSFGLIGIADSGSRLEFDYAAIGGNGNGSLFVMNGALARFGEFLAIAVFDTSEGVVLVEGGGSVIEAGRVGIGIGVNNIMIEHEPSVSRGLFVIRNGGELRVTGAPGLFDDFGHDGDPEAPHDIEIAVLENSFGELVIGGMRGDNAEGSGSIVADRIVFGEGEGHLTFNHTDAAYDFSQAIVGRGTIHVLSGKTVFTGDSSTFSGDTLVDGGHLSVNGILGGAVVVNDKGLVSGSGRIGSLDILDGGTLAAGNSIGVLTIDGDLTFSSGSRLEVEVDPASDGSDRILVGGVARLGGAVVHVGNSGSYRPRSTYTIIEADGGFDGTRFDEVSSEFAFLDPIIGYEATRVLLELRRNDLAFESMAETKNSRSVARALESLGFDNPLFDRVVALDKNEAARAFEALSGSIHPAVTSLRTADALQRNRLIDARLENARDDVSGPREVYASSGGIDNPHLYGGISIWGHAHGFWGERDAGAAASASEQRGAGLQFGADTTIGDAFRIGVTAGYGRTSLDLRAIPGKVSSDDFDLGIYAGAQTPGGTRIKSGLGHTWSALESRRDVAFTGLSDTLTAEYAVSTLRAFAEISRPYDVAGIEIEPFAGIDLIETRTNRFVETGGISALDVAAGTDRQVLTTLGMRIAKDFNVADMDARMRASAGWRHAAGDLDAERSASIAGSPSFVTKDAAVERDTALFGAGIDLSVTERLTASFDYNSQIGASSRNHTARLELRLSF